MTGRRVSLSDKYDVHRPDVFLTGTQALVRLALVQRALDHQSGLNTAGYVSGYRGSPVGAVDQQFQHAAEFLNKAEIVFEPGLNEDLAATAVWGAQQASMRGDGRYDGVFAMWYGKGPGVDRSGDVFRHANMAGSARHGGVLVLMGDDHTCESSTTAHQSEFALMDALIPVLNPANVSEIISLGLHGFALSRFAGVWCGLKCVKDNVESTASIHSPLLFENSLPQFDVAAGGLNIRPNDNRHEQEIRMHRFKLEAVKAYARENTLNHVTIPGAVSQADKPRIGIISTGKSYMDTLQALRELDLDEAACNQQGIALYKVAMPWPLEPQGIREFAKDKELLIVVEEKRSLIEFQLKDILYNTDLRPQIIGKSDEKGAVLLQPEGALNPMQIAEVIGTRLVTMTRNNAVQDRLDDIRQVLNRERDVLGVQRVPYFCAGCPHNSSTVVPEGSRAYAGIGCHWMVQIMERNTEGCTQMGGEGANWIGEAHFSTTGHVFQNIGDGTYNHSGLMAIRAAVAAGTNITFKLLYNDAVAMTGGQSHEGSMSPYDIAAELVSAGVEQLVFVSDQPDSVEKHRLPADVGVFDRGDLMQVQKRLSEISGTTVLIYEQTCAAEKRRRRKRGTMIDPPRRAYIHPDVCEGCGDCGVQSNCVAILPLETSLGRKRQIDQSACNKDFSCINGFCPSFVVLEGAELKSRGNNLGSDVPDTDEPSTVVSLDKPYSIALTGVGGTGVVTIGALLGMAAHIEGKGCGVIDMAGLAQKGGAVVSHIKLAATPDEITAIRLADAGADLLLGCDELVSSEDSILRLLRKNGDAPSHALINTTERSTGEFTRDPDFKLPVNLMRRRIEQSVGEGHGQYVDASAMATAILGDSIGSNLFMLGAAYQLGLIPLTAASIREAITINAVAVDFNLAAFDWGRAWVVNPTQVEERAAAAQPAGNSADRQLSLDALIDDRAERLQLYQSRRYAGRYRRFVETVRREDGIDGQPLTRAVADGLYKLMAYKDEYEVARLYSSGDFLQSLKTSFSGDFEPRLQLAPPLLSRPDPSTGRIAKREFGPWIFKLFPWLAKFRFLRGTWFDPFGHTSERRVERQLINDYTSMIKEYVVGRIPPAQNEVYDTLTGLCDLPSGMRGFGHVKQKNIDKVHQQRDQLLLQLDQLQNPSADLPTSGNDNVARAS